MKNLVRESFDIEKVIQEELVRAKCRWPELAGAKWMTDQEILEIPGGRAGGYETVWRSWLGVRVSNGGWERWATRVLELGYTSREREGEVIKCRVWALMESLGKGLREGEGKVRVVEAAERYRW